MMLLRQLSRILVRLPQVTKTEVRDYGRDIMKDLPEPGKGRNFRRIIHFPEEYTVEPLKVTNLAGRDPVSGRVIAKGIGGGIKHKFHWVDLHRRGPSEGPPLVERVLQVMTCGCRSAHVALVGAGDRLRYIIASENMKAGDLIRSSSHMPRNAVRANEGDAHPLAALPAGTVVHCVEKYPGTGGFYAIAAGSCVTLIRRAAGRAIIQLPSKREVAVDEKCIAVVGRVSNAIHNQIPIGSAQRSRELGNRPRSGLWQRKSGRHGRKIKPLPPLKEVNPPEAKIKRKVRLTLSF